MQPHGLNKSQPAAFFEGGEDVPIVINAAFGIDVLQGG